ncbi:hypothetical protein CEXT_220221 [Caerostris extrusa]|uniref:G-protein coupled receptors family 3 profile domain-containing protein n=1 Tax=Caerostris extrusa TaxID=172846 RepID=A0AAV4MK57_CAEEX|nr:hypothetical protein CEXT_220221 [Caerostris extrusa]
MGCHHSHTHNGHTHGGYHGHAHNGVSFPGNHLTLPPNFNVYPAERHDESMCHWGRREECVFTPGFGWSRGSYKCQCRDGFYSATGKPIFNGSLVESAYKDKMTLNSPTYDMLYVCKRCQPGCDVCEDDSPCLANYNWAFRISLLTISVICIFLTLLLSFYVYRYRKLKVINVASPIFLCITLLGCVIMYCESTDFNVRRKKSESIEYGGHFPVLSMYSCIATKWTRHMGFCLTYSALLLKTWRVSLTYRVKSAHKLKLTDKQLLQWLFPILLVMAIYLGTWTISSPPEAVYIEDWERLKFKQCDYNWWDHSLAIGEFLFLLWGIRVCYNVRNAESVFNEAKKHISWAVHSITIVNIIMVMIHLVILPTAGPDIKYLFGFVRTQLSTTVTVILIFGPKFYRDLSHEEPQDLYQENEELKEEVQKLASQIEFMKIVHMEVNNRHLKPKHGGFFSQTTTNQSPVIKNIYMKFESTDSPDPESPQLQSWSLRKSEPSHTDQTNKQTKKKVFGFLWEQKNWFGSIVDLCLCSIPSGEGNSLRNQVRGTRRNKKEKDLNRCLYGEKKVFQEEIRAHGFAIFLQRVKTGRK